MKDHFVLIDFENVQPKNMGLLKGGAFKIKVFLGASQAKVSLEMAQALQTFGNDAEYIQISGNGSNALDFHIAYYIGRLAVEHPDACFHIISKDTGFDPLVKHLKAQGIECKRSATISDIPHIKTNISAHTPSANTVTTKARPAKPVAKAPTKPAAKPTPKPPVKASSTAAGPPKADRIRAVIDNLSKRGAAKPRALKTLRSSIRATLKPPITNEELDLIVAALVNMGRINISGDEKVTYLLE